MSDSTFYRLPESALVISCCIALFLIVLVIHGLGVL